MIPLFKSHNSIGKSILTLDEPNDKSGPASIIKIAKDNNLKEIFLVEDSMTGYLEAYYNCKKADIKLNFGLRVTICNDINDKTDASTKTEHKFIVFLTKAEAYSALIKIASAAATTGFYYVPRIDVKTLKSFWHKGLTLAVPFYDSFIHTNLVSVSTIIPEFPCKDVTFFYEDNELFIDSYIKEALDKYLNGERELLKVKSIYYNNRKDFINYLAFRCIGKRTTLDKPNMDGMASEEFCFESWRENNEIN